MFVPAPYVPRQNLRVSPKTHIFQGSNKKLLVTSATLVVTGALLVVTRRYAIFFSLSVLKHIFFKSCTYEVRQFRLLFAQAALIQT